MEEYQPGDKVTLTCTATVSGTPTNATAGALAVLRPDGVTVTFLTSGGWSSQGSWNATTNTPTLADGTGTVGHYYTVSVAGTVDLGSGEVAFTTNDRVFYDGQYWRKLKRVQSGTLTNSSTGVYSYAYPTPQVAGVYNYAWLLIGTAAGAEAGAFKVDYNGVWE